MITVLICLTYLATLAFLYLREKDTAKEREQLYDRIQAKDYIEFKTTTEPIEPRDNTKQREREEYANRYVEI